MLRAQNLALRRIHHNQLRLREIAERDPQTFLLLLDTRLFRNRLRLLLEALLSVLLEVFRALLELRSVFLRSVEGVLVQLAHSLELELCFRRRRRRLWDVRQRFFHGFFYHLLGFVLLRLDGALCQLDLLAHLLAHCLNLLVRLAAHALAPSLEALGECRLLLAALR